MQHTSVGTENIPFHVRQYQDADEAGVVALWSAVFANPAPHNDPATSLRKKLEVDRELLLVALIDGAVVGTVMGGYDGHRGWIYSVAVAPQHRRLGIGSALLRQLEVELVKLGCLKVNLQVRTTNSEVIPFYEQLGFSVEELTSMGKKLYS